MKEKKSKGALINWRNKMAKRFTDTDKYKKPFIRGLSGAYKLLWDYLYHDCDNAGIWIKDFEVAQIMIGGDMQVVEDEALTLFSDKIIIIKGGEKWFIPSFVDFQYGELNKSNNAHKSVIGKLLKYKLICDNKGLISSYLGAMDKDKDKDKDMDKAMDKAMDKDKETTKKTKQFKPPTPEEVKGYCEENKISIDHNLFVNYYEARGWMLKGGKMKNWKACVRTWMGNNYGSNNGSSQGRIQESEGTSKFDGVGTVGNWEED